MRALQKTIKLKIKLNQPRKLAKLRAKFPELDCEYPMVIPNHRAYLETSAKNLWKVLKNKVNKNPGRLEIVDGNEIIFMYQESK